jgi:tetratricopeptide (TPR) repeat protein
MKLIRLIILLVAVLFTAIHFAFSQNEETRKVKARIGEILKDEKIEIYDKGTKVRGNPRDILVQDDKIEFKLKKQNTTLHFADLSEDSIKYSMVKLRAVLELKKFYLIKNITGKYTYGIFEELRKDLILIQKQLEESKSVQFEPIASKYRALKVKPTVSEEQRKFIVQANLFNQQKNYNKAIEIYKKAIEIDQIAYPAAYSNVALLYAQINKFNDAIIYMKKYLLLEPEGSDARSAQDKIYEWEAMNQ